MFPAAAYIPLMSRLPQRYSFSSWDEIECISEGMMRIAHKNCSAPWDEYDYRMIRHRRKGNVTAKFCRVNRNSRGVTIQLSEVQLLYC